MRIEVVVTVKAGVPEPLAANALANLQGQGFDQVKGVLVGKWFVLDLNQADRAEAERVATEICEQLLANAVFEDFRILPE